MLKSFFGAFPSFTESKVRTDNETSHLQVLLQKPDKGPGVQIGKLRAERQWNDDVDTRFF
jgi:hypothetical protein